MDIPVGGFAAPQLAMAGQRQVMTHPDVLKHYRHLRTISTEHHTGALKFVARSTPLERAKRLGLAAGHTLIIDNDEEMTLVFDLAIHTAREGRSSAINRYTRALPPPADSGEARMLEAMRQTIFLIWKIARRHRRAAGEQDLARRGSPGEELPGWHGVPHSLLLHRRLRHDLWGRCAGDR
jgi:hypothetical protein